MGRHDSDLKPLGRAAGWRSPLTAMLLLSAAACASTEPPVSGPPVNANGADSLPKLVRFESQAGATTGRTCYGKVTDADDGVPREVQLLHAGTRPLCDPRGTLELGPALRQLNEAVDLLDRPTAAGGSPPETIDAADRARRIKAPVPVELAWIDKEQIFVTAAGINYKAHAEETKQTENILFAKPVVPTEPYRTVAPVERLPLGSGEPVCLLDHEVEIAFVALKAIPLRPAVPPLEQLGAMIAFFAVDDLTDREPIIQDKVRGFTRGKGREGYLPAGPWLVPGKHLMPTTLLGGTEPVDLELALRPAGSTAGETLQYASSKEMMLGLHEILTKLEARDPTSGPACGPDKVCSMPDTQGVQRFMVRGDVLPAGSIVLTGTPGGTRFKLPGKLEGLALLVRGGFSRERAEQMFLADQLRDRLAIGYLQPGDEVNQAVTGLGRQTWSVGSPTAALPAGRCAPAG